MAEVQVLDRAEEPFYTVASLARRWSVTERTVKRMISDGELRSYRIRGARRISPLDVASYEASQFDDGSEAA